MNYDKQNNAVKLFKILANANRVKALRFIAEQDNKPVIAGEIAKATGLSESNLSNHLKLMRISKVISAKQSGANMLYSIKDPKIINLIKTAFK